MIGVYPILTCGMMSNKELQLTYLQTSMINLEIEI